MFEPETGITILNDADVDTGEVFRALQEANPEVAALVRWGQNTQTRQGSLFERDRYITPDRVYDQFRVAFDALDDDVVSGVAESTESLAFAKMSIECEEEDEEDVWNQIAAHLDLDARLREMWRELFAISQYYCAVYWGQKSFKVSGKTERGVKRKKEFNNLRVPLGVTVLDPMKIVPVGTTLFNREKLAYIADKGETDIINQVLNGDSQDPIIESLIVTKYTPATDAERKELVDVLPDGRNGVERLYLMNPNNVFRHTATKPGYQRFANVRMKSVFELLDLKHQLRQMDRSHLIGGTNFIVLIKKGTDQMPAKPAEMEALQAQVRMVARVPVIVGDHRLEVEIITPDNDKTLQPERYNGIDARITARLYQMFMTGNFSAGAKGDDSMKLARVVGRGLESRRHMMRRSLEKFILEPTYERNEMLTSKPKLRFHPKRVALDFDTALATYLLDLRDRGDISRESILEEIDYSQISEARRRKREKDKGYDKTFEPTNVPFSGQGSTPGGAKADGRRLGGNRNGGGSAPGTGQGNAPKNPAKKSDGKRPNRRAQ